MSLSDKTVCGKARLVKHFSKKLQHQSLILRSIQSPCKTDGLHDSFSAELFATSIRFKLWLGCASNCFQMNCTNASLALSLGMLLEAITKQKKKKKKNMRSAVIPMTVTIDYC